MPSPGFLWPSISGPNASVCGLTPADTNVVLGSPRSDGLLSRIRLPYPTPYLFSGRAVHTLGPAENPGPTISLPSTDINRGRLALPSGVLPDAFSPSNRRVARCLQHLLPPVMIWFMPP
jgi:hypothetical protein